MRLLIIGDLDGQIGAASKIARDRGAKVAQVADIEGAFRMLCDGQGADLIMIDVHADIAQFVTMITNERITIPIVACGIHNLPDGLCISETPKSMIAAVHESIADSVGIPHRIVAPQRTAVLLAEQFSAKDGASMRFEGRWLTYRLDKANVRVRDVEGHLRSGSREEDDLIAQWGRAFADEDGTPFDVAEFMLRKRSDGDLYIWDHDGPKSIVTLSALSWPT